MKMFLFRPTPAFVAARTMLSLAIMFCAVVTSVSAAPQFGRPLLHALDESPAGLGSLTVDPSTSSLSGPTPTVLPIVTPGDDPSETPTAGCTTQARAPELEVDPINVANPIESPTIITSSIATSTLVQTNTNGAPYPLGGVNVAIVLSVAASAVFTVF